MINLLPQEQKKALQRYATIRFIVVILLFVCFLTIVATLFLVPVYVFIDSKAKLAQTQLAQITTTEGFKNDETLSEIIGDINKRLNVIGLDKKDVVISDVIIMPLLQAKPATLTLTEIFVAKNEEGIFAVQIGGIAPNRESLQGFVASLEKVSTFINVTLPISNYVKGTDIAYTINFNIKL